MIDNTELRGNSVQKFHGMVAAISAHEPEDEETARMLSMFTIAQSMGALNAITPTDPAAFDRQLFSLSKLGLAMRSDGAALTDEQRQELIDLCG